MKKKKIVSFLKTLIMEIQKDDLISAANDLTYKLFFSMFPFIIFLMSVVGFFEPDTSKVTQYLSSFLDINILNPIYAFIDEIVHSKSSGVLSFSLLISIYSASAGFGTVLKGVNKAYGQKDNRNFIIKTLIRMAMVIIFVVIIAISFVLLIFGNTILQFLTDTFGFHSLIFVLFGFFRYVVAIVILFFSVILINKLAISRKTTFKSILPGAIFTIVLWIIVSMGFNLYVENFSNYANVYGSIAGIMVVMLWLNLMCNVLLIGSEINAIIELNNKSLNCDTAIELKTKK